MKVLQRTFILAAIFGALSLGSTAVAQTTETTETPGQPDVPIEKPEKPDVSKDDATTAPKPLEKPKTTAELRDRITFLLSGYEFFPTRDDLDRLASADEVTEVLIDLVQDDDASVMHRLRAVDALGYYDSPRVAAFLRKLTRGAEEAGFQANARHSALMQHHAITALARSKRGESVSDLEPFLAGSDLQLKLTAIVALGKHGKDDGRERLRTLVESDDNKHVQREARKFLK